MPAGTRLREQGANAFLGWGLKYLQRSDRAEPGGAHSLAVQSGGPHTAAPCSLGGLRGGDAAPRDGVARGVGSHTPCFSFSRCH